MDRSNLIRTTRVRRFEPRRESGAVLVLVLVFLPIALMIVAFMIYLGFYTMNDNAARASAKALALGLIERYARLQCSTGEDNYHCHRRKMHAALRRANGIVTSVESILHGVDLQEYGGGALPAATSYVRFEPGQYFFTRPHANPPASCAGSYPCFIPLHTLPDGKFANAFRVFGALRHDNFAYTLKTLLWPGFSSRQIDFTTIATTIPLHGMFLIDKSISTAEETHRRPNYADLALPKDPASPQNSSLAFDVNDAGEVIGDLYTQVWNRLDDDRSNPPSNLAHNPQHHAKTDYVRVRAVSGNFSSYNSYSFKHKHPQPGIRSVSNPAIDDDYKRLKLDLYRDVSSGSALPYRGAEPWLSILKGVDAAIQIMEQRSVATDMLGVIFYDTHLKWNDVINLSHDLSYVKSVVDIPRIVGRGDFQQAQAAGGLLSDYNTPLWIKLGIFPQPGGYTNPLAAITEATAQLALASADGGQARAFIMDFGDGLNTCSTTDPNNAAGPVNCDSESYLTYKAGTANLNQLVRNMLVGRGVEYHMFITGEQVGPHFMGYRKEMSGTECLTDSEARLKGYDTVDGASCGNNFQCQTKYNNRFGIPFTRAVFERYQLTKMTGGTFMPRLRSGSGCNAGVYNANSAASCVASTTGVFRCNQSNTTSRKKFECDPLCRSVEDQVSAYVRNVFEQIGSSYVIVDTD